MKVKEINFGLAYRIGDVIYVNNTLKLDSEVYHEIMRHEFNHDDGEYSLNDLKLDLKPPSLRTHLFCLRHPSTWVIFSPVVFLDGKWRYDLASIVFMSLGFILGGLICLIMI